MKKYILIVFGDFNDYEVCKSVALSVTPIVDSPHLKFQKNNGAMIFHFASEVSQEEINDYLLGGLIENVSAFILSEFSDNMTLNFPNDVLDHLLNLEEENDSQIKLNARTEVDEESSEFLTLLIEEIKKEVKRPSLDSLLEKIQEKGIDSLSKFEKETLDEYSKL